MTAFPNLHALAYGEGGQRLSAELRVEAADALERIKSLTAEVERLNNRAQQLAKHQAASDRLAAGRCVTVRHLTPAHDKEKP